MLSLRHATGNLVILRTSFLRSNSKVLGSWGLRPYATQDDPKAQELARVKPLSTAPKGNIGLKDHRINKFEKYLMVWAGKYKSVSDVPDLVSQDSLERARNKARIKINIFMGAMTLLGCFAMIWSGKKAQSEGQSVAKINQEWHNKMREEAKEKAALEAAKKA